MPFLIEKDKEGNKKITDLDSHKKTPCDLCISGAFRLGYTLHDECSKAIAKMTEEEKEKTIQMLNEENKKNIEKLPQEKKAEICKDCGHYRNQHHPLGVADWGTGCAIKFWTTDEKTKKPKLVDCPCKEFKSLVEEK